MRLKNLKRLLTCLIIGLVEHSSAYNILIVGAVEAKSTHHLTVVLENALADAGHSVTHINPFTNYSSHENVTAVRFKVPFSDDINMFEIQNSKDVFSWLINVYKIYGPALWTDEEILSLWKKRNLFDAIIMNGATNEIGTPFLIDFKGVYVSFCTAGLEYSQIGNYGHWLPLSVVPHILRQYDEHMTFLERVINPISQFIGIYMYVWTACPLCQQILYNYFPDMEPFERYYFNSSLLLINSHFALDSPLPLLPNQIEIGTLIARKPNPLPKVLLDFIEGSGDNGTIYFNLGTMAKSEHIPLRYKKVLISAFSKLPQKILWKYEGNDLELPPNVMTRTWLPQQDILGHPKTRVFISHCGNLGTQEAKYHGVPVLAMPVAFDQHRNAVRLVKQGFGIQLNWEDLTEERFLKALSSLLQGKNLANKVKEVSQILQNQKESAAERAVWWIEYVIRHKGAPHMTYAGKRLHFLQYIMIDALAVWVLILSVLFYSFYKVAVCCKNIIAQKSKMD